MSHTHHGHTHDHEHHHEHHHDHAHHDELSPQTLSRRVFLTRAAGLVLTLGTGALWQRGAHAAAARNPYSGGVWLAGDHHIHTRFSPDGQYLIAEQVALAARHGLKWCVITDHGGPRHDKVALEQAYPELLAARRAHPGVAVFQGLEWNIPNAEHGSVIVPPSVDEARRVAEFEAQFDERNASRPNTPANVEADAVAGVKYLQSLNPKPLFIANHPARRGLDSPHEMRAWHDAGPDVTRGFEGAPGHQAANLVGVTRGYYDSKPGPNSFRGYPAESYRTWGGYDYYVAKVGGLWDSLLGEGRAWYVTANSDAHRHYTDRTEVDASTYLSKGFVSPTARQAAKAENADFHPGEYAKTWVHAARPAPLAILDSMRAGNMFTVLGDLVTRLELFARSDGRVAPMGGTLLMQSGADVEITIRLQPPQGLNRAGQRPALHHVDIIAGDILGPAADRDAMTNPTTRVVAQVPAARLRREGAFLSFTMRFPKVRQSFYVRVRGTNTAVDAPRQDVLRQGAPAANPWDDLWFYSNPVFVRLPATPR